MVDEDASDELVEELREKADLPRAELVAYLRARELSNRQVVTGAGKLPEPQQWALCLALLELRPTLPEPGDEAAENERWYLASAVCMSSTNALDAGDTEQAARIVTPYLGVTAEFPFLAHAAARAFTQLGGLDDAIAQVRIAVENRYEQRDDLETDEVLAPLHGLPAFKKVFEDYREGLRQAVWKGWPAIVPVPPRLRELAAYTSYPNYATVGDFDLDCEMDDFLIKQYRGDLADVLAELQTKLPAFAKEGTGGHLMFWMRDPDPQRWPVVWWDSEGQINAVGDSLDDFLALAAGTWEDGGGFLEADDELKAWAAGVGIQAHAQGDQRREELRALTLEFLRWFGEQYRSICARLHPERELVVDAVPGQGIGRVRLSAPKAEVDAVLGAPNLASWQGPEDPAFSAYYEQSPYTVSYARPAQTVADITIYSEWIRVRFPDGFEPMLARMEDVEAWLRGQNQPYQIDWRDLVCPGLGLELTIDRSREGRISWIEHLKLQRPGSGSTPPSPSPTNA